MWHSIVPLGSWEIPTVDFNDFNSTYNMYNLRATAHAADPSNSEEEVKEEAMHGWV